MNNRSITQSSRYLSKNAQAKLGDSAFGLYYFLETYIINNYIVSEKVESVLTRSPQE